MTSKRQHKENNLNLKHEALLELEKGKTNKEVSKFFNVPPNVSDYATKPSFNDAMDAITLLENYSLFTKFGADLMKALEDINRVMDIDSQSNKRQDFFA